MGNWNRSRSERERAVTRCCRRLWQRTRSGKHDHLERKWWPQGRILFLCCSYSLSLSFDPSCSSSSSSVLYVCVFKNSAKSETPGRRGLLLLVYRYFFLLKKYGKCFFFFFFFFQTFAIFGLHKLEGDGRWDSFFFFLGPIRKFHWYEPAQLNTKQFILIFKYYLNNIFLLTSIIIIIYKIIIINVLYYNFYFKINCYYFLIWLIHWSDSMNTTNFTSILIINVSPIKLLKKMIQPFIYYII